MNDNKKLNTRLYAILTTRSLPVELRHVDHVQVEDVNNRSFQALECGEKHTLEYVPDIVPNEVNVLESDDLLSEEGLIILAIAERMARAFPDKEYIHMVSEMFDDGFFMDDNEYPADIPKLNFVYLPEEKKMFRTCITETEYEGTVLYPKMGIELVPIENFFESPIDAINHVANNSSDFREDDADECLEITKSKFESFYEHVIKHHEESLVDGIIKAETREEFIHAVTMSAFMCGVDFFDILSVYMTKALELKVNSDDVLEYADTLKYPIMITNASGTRTQLSSDIENSKFTIDENGPYNKEYHQMIDTLKERVIGTCAEKLFAIDYRNNLNVLELTVADPISAKNRELISEALAFRYGIAVTANSMHFLKDSEDDTCLYGIFLPQGESITRIRFDEDGSVLLDSSGIAVVDLSDNVIATDEPISDIATDPSLGIRACQLGSDINKVNLAIANAKEALKALESMVDENNDEEN